MTPPQPSNQAEHSTPVRLYYQVYAALMVLLVLTVGVAYLPIGIFGTLLAVTIATIKAALVILYFMHVRQSSRLVWLYAGMGFAWLGIMIVLTMSDYLSRGWLRQ